MLLACRFSYQDKGQDASQHILWPLLTSKIQLSKNKWACHYRSVNLFGLKPVFAGLYRSAFTKNLDPKEGESTKIIALCPRYHRGFIKLLLGNQKGAKMRPDRVTEDFTKAIRIM